MMGKYQNTSTLGYSWGDVTVTIGLDGNKFDHPDRILDHMMTTAIATIGVDTVQYAISECRENGGTEQTCNESVEIGEIKLHAQLAFKSKRRISNRTLNSILFGAVLPNLLKTAAIYIGDNSWESTPAKPLQARPHGEILHDLASSLSLSQPARPTPAHHEARELLTANT